MVLLVVAAALVGCGKASESANDRKEPVAAEPKLEEEAEIPPEVAEALRQVTAVKSIALDNATITVHRAYEYSGPTSIAAPEIAKTIAVDATFSGYTDRFKLWDVDIIDGSTDENFGSEPEIAFLDAEGKFLSYEGDEIDFTKPIRLLMVFAALKMTDSIKLGYWGRDLTPTAVPLESSGMTLPGQE